MPEAFGVIADTRAMKRLASDLGKVEPATRRALQRTIRAVAVKVEAEAAERANFSKRISGSGKVRVAGLGAKVTFGGGDAYIAVPIENRGKGNVTHPTFGHEPNTNKNSHPAFLEPAFEAHVEEYVEALTDALITTTNAVLKDY